MQPYFFPYAGYYRLLATTDLFLIFDCVQFVRRGRMHRSELPGRAGREWLTLPLARALRETRIDRVRLAPNARQIFDAELARQDWFRHGSGPSADRVRSWLSAPMDNRLLVDYVEYTLRETADLLGLRTRIARTSSLALGDDLRGPSRVIAAAVAVGASEYVNAPGGISLYDPVAFTDTGITLLFLEPYLGRFPHMLPALMERPADEISDDIHRTTRLVPC